MAANLENVAALEYESDDSVNGRYDKFLEVLDFVNVKIPTSSEKDRMPAYARNLKDLLSNMRKFGDYENIVLADDASAILQKKLPPKLKDYGIFSFPCCIGRLNIEAMIEFRASVSLLPSSVVEKIGVGELKPTTISIQFSDGSIKNPKGVMEDLPCRVGDLIIPIDFVVLEIEEDQEIPIIFGRPFLDTAGAQIDVSKGTFSFNIGTKKEEFSMPNLSPKFPSRFGK